MAGESVLMALEVASLVLHGAGIRYALIGGAALPAWGRIRATADADILIQLRLDTDQGKLALGLTVKALREAGFAHLERADRQKLEDKWVFQFWFPIREHGISLRVDLIATGTREDEEIFNRAVLRKVDGFTVPVASCEDLILLKLAAARPVDLADATELLTINKEALDMTYLEGRAAQKKLTSQLREILQRAK